MRLYNYTGNERTNSMCIELDLYTIIWFNYERPIAFRTPETGLVICENENDTRTAKKHLRRIRREHENLEFVSSHPWPEFQTRLNDMMDNWKRR